MKTKKPLKPAPAYQWYPRDMNAIEAVASLDNEAYGLFRRLYDHAWLNDGLPTDPEAIYPVSRCGTRKKFDQLWMQIEPLFPPNGDGRRHNSQQEEHRRGLNKFKRQRQLAALTRHQRDRDLRNARALHPHRDIDAVAVHVESSAFASALALSSVDPRSKAGVQGAPTTRRAIRMPLSIYEVRRHLLAATHRLIESGAPYVTEDGSPNVYELGCELKDIAARDLRAQWDSAGELQAILEAVLARRARMAAAALMKANAEARELEALGRLFTRTPQDRHHLAQMKAARGGDR